MIYLLFFIIFAFIISIQVAPEDVEESEPEQDALDEELPLSRYYTVTWDLKTGEIKIENNE
jgi:hypothetical protein